MDEQDVRPLRHHILPRVGLAIILKRKTSGSRRPRTAKCSNLPCAASTSNGELNRLVLQVRLVAPTKISPTLARVPVEFAVRMVCDQNEV